jgi:predicted DNA-binding transcriptional regulator AlpA
MENTRQTTQDECWTLTVPVAGKRLGLSRGASYDAAKRGDLPGLIRIGRRLMVSKVALERALENGWTPKVQNQ